MPHTYVSGILFDHYKVSTISGEALQTIEGLSIPEHDYIDLTYSGATLTGVVYKTGGSGGATVATLALTYSGTNLTSVAKS